MASGSLKDTIRALNQAFAGYLNVEVLPEGLQRAIDVYLDKHQDPDDHDEQRLQEELASVYKNSIVKDEEKLGIFLLAVIGLRPAIRRQDYLEEWWKVIVAPVIDGVGHTRLAIKHASALLLDIMDYDRDADESGQRAAISSHFAGLLLDAYLKRTQLQDLRDDNLNNVDQFVASQLSEVLLGYGRRKPKEFMQILDRLVVAKDQRMQILGLLSAFVRHQPPHLYLVRETSLIEHLLQCLLVDTSTTVISLALTILIMFLPHIPSTVKKHLPRLFLIYSRLLCWEKHRPLGDEEDKVVDDGEEEEEDDGIEGKLTNIATDTAPEETWDRLESSFDAAESSTPELMHYFTFLYGLYPLNFTSYIRKPRKYLKNINFPRADEFDLDQKIIRSRSEQFSRLHLLHPSFTQTTLEDELTDDRWLKSDPADVVAECMSLSLSVRTLNPPREIPASPEVKEAEVPPALMKTEDIPLESLLGYGDDASSHAADNVSLMERASSRSSHTAPSTAVTSPTGHNITELTNPLHRAMMQAQLGSRAQSPAYSSPLSRPFDDYGDSPTLGATVTPQGVSTSRSQRNGSIASLNTGTEASPRMPPMHASSRDQLPHSPALRAASQTEANLSYLQREVTLLKNDLNFERYLKQQHLSHIGQLQRKHIREATIEAETQNLININRILKNKLAEANKAYALLKKETALSRSQAKKHEADLTSRMRRMKEEERERRAIGDSLVVELNRAQSDCDSLRQLVVDSEAKELQARQEVASGMLKLEQLEAVHKRMQDLEAKIKTYEAQEVEFERANQEKHTLETQLASTQLKLRSRSSDSHTERNTQDLRIQELEERLLAFQNPTANGLKGQLAPQAQRVIEQAVAASKAKYSSLKKEHISLQHRFVDLDIRYRELEREAAEIATAKQLLATSPSTTKYFNSPPTGQSHGHAMSSRTSSRRGNSFDEETSLAAAATSPPSYARNIPIPIPNALHRYDTHGSTSTTSGTPPSSYRDRNHASRAPNVSRSNPSPKLDGMPSSSATSPPSVFSHPPMPPQQPTVNNAFFNPTSPPSAAIVGSSSNRHLHRTSTINSLRQFPGSPPLASTGRNIPGEAESGMTGIPRSTTGSSSARTGERSDGRSQSRGGAPGFSSKAGHGDEELKRKEKKDKPKFGGLLGIRGIT